MKRGNRSAGDAKNEDGIKWFFVGFFGGIFILLFLAIIFSGCNRSEIDESINQKETAHSNFKTIDIEGCQYIFKKFDHSALAHKGNCPNPIHAKDTFFVYGVQIRYGTRDTIFTMYPIDSAEVAVGYLKESGQLRGITE